RVERLGPHLVVCGSRVGTRLPRQQRGLPHRPGPGVDAPPVIVWSPDLGMITFENRARTVASESTSTIGDNFFRTGGGWSIRAEGTVALGRKTRVESVALPDPNLYAARALAASLARR